MTRLWKFIKAYTILFVQMVLHQPLKRLRERDTSAPGRFLQSYGTSDHLLPRAPEALSRRWGHMGCVHCGLCDSACETLAQVRRTELVSLSAVAIAYTRSPPEASFARQAVEHLGDCEACAAAEALCPTQVPIRELVEDLAAEIQDQAQAMERLLPERSGG